MYLVKASNTLLGREFKAQFETESEANDWVQAMIAKNSWGKPARQTVKGLGESYVESQVISESDEIDEFGETITIVSLKADYTYEGPTEITGMGATDEDKELRKQKAKEKIAQWRVFKSFGEDVQIYFTALINERGYDQAQKDALQTSPELMAIMAELGFGRIAKAKSLIATLTADDVLFYQDDINDVIQFINDFLVEIV